MSKSLIVRCFAICVQLCDPAPLQVHWSEDRKPYHWRVEALVDCGTCDEAKFAEAASVYIEGYGCFVVGAHDSVESTFVQPYEQPERFLRPVHSTMVADEYLPRSHLTLVGDMSPTLVALKV